MFAKHALHCSRRDAMFLCDLADALPPAAVTMDGFMIER
jgi:hypothetical protein